MKVVYVIGGVILWWSGYFMVKSCLSDMIVKVNIDVIFERKLKN